MNLAYWTAYPRPPKHSTCLNCQRYDVVRYNGTVATTVYETNKTYLTLIREILWKGKKPKIMMRTPCILLLLNVLCSYQSDIKYTRCVIRYEQIECAKPEQRFLWTHPFILVYNTLRAAHLLQFCVLRNDACNNNKLRNATLNTK